jgi:rhodanese-related sulfurtransferase
LLRASLHNQFPQVQWITTRELADWLEDRHRPPPVLLDVRTVEEWNVSHLPVARRVDPGASAEMALPGAARDVPVVTYCAVGYRSAEFSTRLGAAGFTHVQNLEGSIFRWANEHRPLVSDGAPASRVRPYSKSWGQLLADDVRAGL